MARPMETLTETKCRFDHKCPRSFAHSALTLGLERFFVWIRPIYTTGPDNELKKGSYLGYRPSNKLSLLDPLLLAL